MANGFRATVWSVGHSRLRADQLLGRLKAHGIATVIDVRAYPASRRFPWFAQAAMEAWLPAAGIRYRHLPELGGRRRMPAAEVDSVAGWQHPAFRAYALHMQTAEFWRGLAAAQAEAERNPTALMCSEALWWRCHRRLVADALVCQGWEVLHIATGSPIRHQLSPFARWDGRRLTYPLPHHPRD
jgi:uncharacterized protein (DUF488 family)